MDKWQALHEFWSSFGWAAYDESAVPDDADVSAGYITYEARVGRLDNPLTLNASLYIRSTRWDEISRKCDEILRVIGEHGHVVITLETGFLWLTEAVAERMAEPGDDTIRRILLTITAEYLTAY